MPRPDALFLPASVKKGRRIGDRVRSVTSIAEPLLEVDYAGGERAIIRDQRDGRMFITRNPLDTIYFPTGHPRSGTPRYRWERRTDGTELGYLLDAE
jgi:hypothetical protein